MSNPTGEDCSNCLFFPACYLLYVAIISVPGLMGMLVLNLFVTNLPWVPPTR